MFHGMKIYSVHVKPEEPVTQARPVFVKEGFNIAAFLLPVLWALYHRLWLPFIVLLALNILIMTLGKNHVLSEFSMAAVDMGFRVIIGFLANDWLRKKLSHQGYIFADISAAESQLRAEQRYFERSLAVA